MSRPQSRNMSRTHIPNGSVAFGYEEIYAVREVHRRLHDKQGTKHLLRTSRLEPYGVNGILRIRPRPELPAREGRGTMVETHRSNDLKSTHRLPYRHLASQGGLEYQRQDSQLDHNYEGGTESVFWLTVQEHKLEYRTSDQLRFPL